MRRKAVKRKDVKKSKNKFFQFAKKKNVKKPFFSIDSLFETKKKVRKKEIKEDNASINVISTRLFGSIVDENKKYFESL
ncbi:MAG: hypothetical protein KKI14_02680, partial [Nanoarchaeota archaeon]|nr:hypothetical protein [Nanoarchaeota archaeon]